MEGGWDIDSITRLCDNCKDLSDDICEAIVKILPILVGNLFVLHMEKRHGRKIKI
jgi:hypothetical protein